MGNLVQQCRGVVNTRLEVDRPNDIYFTNEIISGTVSHLSRRHASVLLTGIIYFNKRKKTGLEKCQIEFFSMEVVLRPSLSSEQKFQFRLADHLPPSFNNINIYPNISYTVNLIYKQVKDQVQSTIPIRICPRVQIDRPLLLKPFFFGPIENQLSGIKLDIKVNRAVFTYDDIIQIYYELQNPNEEYIHKTQISLGVYYLIESNVWQEDVCNGIENVENISSKNKLIRNKALLNIPKKIYLPPSYKFQHERETHPSSFSLSIDYKIQFKIFLDNSDNLWQVDIPIVLCNDTIERIEINEDDIDVKTEPSLEVVDRDVNITE